MKPRKLFTLIELLVSAATDTFPEQGSRWENQPGFL